MSKLVIKVGGAFLDKPEIALAFFKQLVKLKSTHQLVIVHGGGDIVEALFSKLGFITQKLDGLRVTPEEQLPYLVGALAGTANKQLLSLAIKSGLAAVGLCLADGNTTECAVVSQELGAVGKVVSGQETLLNQLLEQGYLPLISSIGCSQEGQLLNVNADQAATALAQVLDAELLLLSNVPGVLDGDKQLINKLTPALMDDLIASQVIRDGMTVKVKAAQEAASILGRPVTIASWQNPEKLTEFLENGQFGTQVFPVADQQEAM